MFGGLWYTYCVNNPLKYTDPSGKEAYYINNSDGRNSDDIKQFINSLMASNGSLNSLDLSSFDLISSEEVSRIVIPIFDSLVERGGGTENIDKNDLKEVIAAATIAALRFLEHDIPEGGMLFFDFDNIIVLNATGTAGLVQMSKGFDAGKIGVYNGYIHGIGYDVSIGIGMAKIYYSGDYNNLRLKNLEGAAYQFSAGYGIAEAGIMISDKLVQGGYLIGFVGGINFSLSPFSVSGQKSVIKIDQ